MNKPETVYISFYGETQLLVVGKELISVEKPLSVEDARLARFARYGRKTNSLKNYRL